NNALGFGTDPKGNAQFVGGVSQGGPAFANAQHDISFGSGQWTMTVDFCAGFSGRLPAADNLGILSLEPGQSSNCFQTAFLWSYPNNNTANAQFYGANIGHWGPDGGIGGSNIVFETPGSGWDNIPVGDWMRESVTWDFGSNRILDMSLTDLTLYPHW